MVRLPWRTDSGDERADNSEELEPREKEREDAIITCECQDGTLSVYETEVFLERTSRSKFADKPILMDEITGVEYSEGIVIGYIQIEQVDFENSDGGFLSAPVDENTLHFGHGKRECVREGRDAILERVSSA